MNGEERSPVLTPDYRRGWMDAMAKAIVEVGSHWNDKHTMTNQKDQAMRSSEVLQRIANQGPE